MTLNMPRSAMRYVCWWIRGHVSATRRKRSASSGTPRSRPIDKNGFGLSVAETDRLARVIERDFEFLPDRREVHDRSSSLLVAHSIQGVRVHDARLAASMYVHGVGHILTINVRDFRRFDGLRIVHPTELQDAQ